MHASPSLRILTSPLWISIAAGIMLAAGSSARATPIAYSTGLASPAATITFTGLTDGTVVGSTYAGQGVTFGGLFVTSQFGSTLGSGTTAPAAANFDGNGVVNSVFTISFSTVMNDAAFFLATDGFGTTITSKLAGNTVETTSAAGFNPNATNYFGFVNSAFDSITIAVAGTGTAVIDNVELGAAGGTPIPEPGAGGVLLAGLVGLGMLGARRRV